MRYRIKEMIDDVQLRHGGQHYLDHIKQAMIYKIAAKMMEVFGEKPTDRDSASGRLFMCFDVRVDEAYEIDREAQYDRRMAFEDGYASAKACMPWGFDEQYE